jgi:ornithine decarboxylase
MTLPSQLTPDLIEALVARHGSPLLLCSPQTAVQQYRAIQDALPRVDIHYALKPLPHPWIVSALKAEDAHFDLATNGEVDLVHSLAVDPERCIHTHPIKRDSDIRHALDYGCATFVCDNIDELDKFIPYRDRARILIRISFRSKDAKVDLSWKFGVQPDNALEMILAAAERELEVAGLCFHVGSQNLNSYKYIEAIQVCRRLFDLAALDGVFMDTLDIGGGFPVAYQEAVMPIDVYCRPIVDELERLFPDTRLIAEPGRFISAPAVSAVSSVMGRAERQGVWWYYLDDGLYSSYSGILFDHTEYPINALRELRDPDLPKRPSVIAGPTCDSIDVPYPNVLLPELDDGDIFVSPMMGAYTWSTATEFNFFPKPTFINIDEEELP